MSDISKAIDTTTDEYFRGYHRGFIEGQCEGLKNMGIMAESLANPRPILISKTAETASLMDLIKDLRQKLHNAEAEKEAINNPQPLTLERLKERIGKPVYVISKDGIHKGWEVVEEYKDNGQYGKRLLIRGGVLFVDNYNFYDHEPKGK